MPIAAGKSQNCIVVGEHFLPTRSPSELAGYRLKYRIASTGDATFAPVGGIIQLARIMTTRYHIVLSRLREVKPGMRYPVRVRVVNTRDGSPRSNMETTAELQLELSSSADDDEKEPKPFKRTARTDADGYALFSFDLPSGHKYERGKIIVSARLGVLQQQEEISLDYSEKSHILLSTDKPIYQPGQTVHMRVLAYGPDDFALPGAEVELEISGEFRTKIKTSKYGIGSADWKIPDNISLNDYTIEADLESGDWYESSQQEKEIKISRYDLPDFSVKATPNFTYYTKDRKASVQITAQYLFGEPLKQGKVRIIRKENCRDSKSSDDECEIAAGDLKSDGTFSADISLEEDFKNIYDSDLFKDIPFTVSVTDASTRKTEQRRFDLRITNQPIHIYASEQIEIAAGSLTAMYITAYYADGTPATVDVSINAMKPNARGEFNESAKRPLIAIPLKTVRTNTYGVAKITDLQIPNECLLSHGGNRSQYGHLRFIARDSQGVESVKRQNLYIYYEERYLHLRPGKTMHQKGDDIQVAIETPKRQDRIIVDVIGKSGVLQSKVVQLIDGCGNVRFPYDSRFDGEVYVVGYAMSKPDADGSVSVLYPFEPKLSLTAQMAKNVYRPGEQAVAKFSLTVGKGNPVQGALGAVVFDKAISERVRTDLEFGGRGFGFSDPSYIYISDLYQWNDAQPEELDLLAEIRLNEDDHSRTRNNVIDMWYGGGYYLPDEIYKDTLQGLQSVLPDSYKKTGKSTQPSGSKRHHPNQRHRV